MQQHQQLQQFVPVHGAQPQQFLFAPQTNMGAHQGMFTPGPAATAAAVAAVNSARERSDAVDAARAGYVAAMERHASAAALRRESSTGLSGSSAYVDPAVAGALAALDGKLGALCDTVQRLVRPASHHRSSSAAATVNDTSATRGARRVSGSSRPHASAAGATPRGRSGVRSAGHAQSSSARGAALHQGADAAASKWAALLAGRNRP
jgi:hypothetical protein